jgi:nucleoside-diphosphate-sugar epimerase
MSKPQAVVPLRPFWPPADQIPQPRSLTWDCGHKTAEDIAEAEAVESLVRRARPEVVVEFAAQAGVRSAQKIMRPMQTGEITETFADTGKLNSLCGYRPALPLAEGVPRFVQWYWRYYEA